MDLATLPCIIDPRERWKGGKYMSQAERRLQLLHILCIRRHDTYDNLVHEFNVCKRTIRYDVAALMCAYPIETVCGRYGGGVWVRGNYFPYRKTLSAKQIALLTRLSTQLVGD